MFLSEVILEVVVAPISMPGNEKGVLVTRARTWWKDDQERWIKSVVWMVNY